MKLPFGKKKTNKQKHASQRREFLLPNRTTKTGTRARNRILRFWGNIKATWGIKNKFRWVYLGYLLLGIMAVVVGLSLISPYFSLKTIKVVRTSPTLNVEQIEKSIMDYKGKNMLFLSTNSVRRKILSDFSAFEDVDVTETWPDSLTIRVTLAMPHIQIKNSYDDNSLAITNKGIVLGPGLDAPERTITLNQYEKPLPIGKELITEEEILFFDETEELLGELLPVKADNWTLLWAARELHATYEGNFVLWFDLSQDPKEQVQKLLSAKEELQLFERKYQHIDLRIPEHIYFQ